MLQELESFLAHLTLYPELVQFKNMELDLKGKLNPTGLLNQLFFEQKCWLTFNQFCKYYYHTHFDTLKTQFADIESDAFKNGLRARLYRTQLGILTEYHAYFLAQNVFGKTEVVRTIALDRAGVDFQIIYNSERYNIHIFVDTPRAWAFRNYKTTHKNGIKLDGIHVNFPYALKNNQINSLRFLNNGFGVYTTTYFNYLKKEMTAGNIKNNNILGVQPQGFIYMP